MNFPTLNDFIAVLRAYFTPEMPLQRVLHALGTVLQLGPLVELNTNQRQLPRQQQETAWMHDIEEAARLAYKPEEMYDEAKRDWDGEEYTDGEWEPLQRDVETMFDILNWPASDIAAKFRIDTPKLLITRYRHCFLCPSAPPLYHNKTGLTTVPLIDEYYKWKPAFLAVAKCNGCHAVYHPDRITLVGTRRVDGTRMRRRQILDCHTPYLRISLTRSLWVHREVARTQEIATHRFRASWLGFTDFFNRAFISDEDNELTEEQVQKMFIEHMTRRLIIEHGIEDEFRCSVDASSETLLTEVLEKLGRLCGIIPGALDHVCNECTHEKRYFSDLIAEGIDLNVAFDGVVGGQETIGNEIQQPNLPHQEAPPPGIERPYVQMAVTDGKTLKYRICAWRTDEEVCRGPLENYSNGRFCKDHAEMINICGIKGCGHPVIIHETLSFLTCDLEEHIATYNRWKSRFASADIHKVRRAIRKQAEWLPKNKEANLDEDDQLEVEELEHMFRARTTYCLQTVQWACGVPIGWGICFESESPTQVYDLLQFIWPNKEGRPAFIAYDKACKLLAHIMAHEEKRHWIETTRFVVDSWHYINHKATDYLCSIWCNPSPSNGSQPDLVLGKESPNGEKVTVRAFNTQTAEQLNSWMDGYESQTRQMTDKSFAFYCHCILLIYKDSVEGRIKKANEKKR
ncbi:hypothetical protein M422DRAFT_254684 [Sphaerobolus stellatus SS14]|uniref:CxC5 like cysteine cluster associated with KDZ domain-containing protein n=1 Tax=Sphaerobolus stellatus (strain SS14) TaxID=990650 RepID=A0A0C9VUL7_SPHS4|nr:hypothetical protein M422DRAFT_254684 [Sphaerobolus stellatus SS14]